VQNAYETIRSEYLHPLDSRDLRRSAVRGMVEELDEFSRYFPPPGGELLTDRVLGVRRGLGLEWEILDGAVRVIGSLFGSPAHKAGLYGPDEIVGIDGRDVHDLSEQEIRAVLDDPASPAALESDRTVALEIRAAPLAAGDPSSRRTVTLRAGEFSVQTVQGLYRGRNGQWVWRIPGPGDVHYMRVAEFCPQTSQDVRNALRRLPHLKGLVLDLRGNPGGLLEDGIAVADLLLDAGEIVTICRRGGALQVHHAHPDTPFADVPLAVLIDEQTASAAELLAGSLAANARAMLLGGRTRGKGCVQSIIRLGDELGQVYLTTAEFFFAPDRPIARRAGGAQWGVDPHLAVALPDEMREILRRLRVVAQVVPNPQPIASDADSADDPRRRLGETIRKADAQLDRAATLLGDAEAFRKRIETLRAETRAAAEERKRKQKAPPENGG
jgi:carboxyl-terminal processing protease